MTQVVNIDFFDSEISLSNPEVASEWIEALRSECEDFASSNYATQYESSSYDEVCSKKLKEFAGALSIAIEEFRSDETISQDSWKAEWEARVYSAAVEVFSDDEFESAQETSLDENSFSDLYESIDEAMSSIDGPVADAESVYESLRELTIDLMLEKDTSDVLDLLKNSDITMMFTPGVNAIKQSLSDNMYYSERVTNDGPSSEALPLLNLLRIDGASLLGNGSYSVDYRDESSMELWDSLLASKASSPLGKVSEFRISEFKEIIENSGEYALPTWVGSMSIEQIIKTNFREPVVFKGGIIGGVDFINGSGHIIDVGERHVLLNTDTTLNEEVGYTVSDIFDCNSSELKSEIMSLGQYQIHLDEELEKKGISKDQMSFEL